MHSQKLFLCFFLFANFLLFCSGQTVRVINVGSTQQQINTAFSNVQPGTRIEFAPGTHIWSFFVGVTLTGTAAQPIIITSQSTRATVNQTAGQNILNIDGSHFVIRNLAFTGGSRGLRFGATQNTADVLIEDVVVFRTPSSAITFNDNGRDYARITIRRTEIHTTGVSGSSPTECLYLGCNTDACQFHDSLIEEVLCRDLVRATTGAIQIKDGSYRNTIRNTVAFNTPSVGIHIYDDFNRGRNTVEGCVVVNAEGNGIQFTAGSNIFNNIVVNSGSNQLLELLTV